MNEAKRGTLFLIPNLLGEVGVDSSLPTLVGSTVQRLSHFVVEEEKSARRLIKALCPDLNIRELTMSRLDEHTRDTDIGPLLSPLLHGTDMGVISEAGLPAVADPGSAAVRYAHSIGSPVRPLVGPCSMMLALMGSGLNGQRWRFLGYLPIDEGERRKAVKELEQAAVTLGETQIFMDAPYRNQKLFSQLLEVCRPESRLCVAQSLTTPDEFICTRTVAEWRKSPTTLSKDPALFLLGT